METRRDFLKTAAALGSSTLVWSSIPEAIARAVAIDPVEGSTYLDAEHVVILMQENRSFDHAYGSMRGVRGYRDPRAHVLPSGDAVWFQADTDGSIVPPFRMDMDNSNVTWIGGTPHSWRDQVDARNGGHYDKWLIAKRRGDKFPMTMGFFTREDIPFYYALADAFTVCDYAFCSSLTGTTPNRLYLWTGTIRESAQHPARVQNGDTDYEDEAAWTTYPERLEDAGISWKIYQNEISLDTGLVGEEDAWLSNFTDNPIEWFTQYRVRFSKTHRAHLPKMAQTLETRIAEAKSKLSASPAAEEKTKLEKQITDVTAALESVRRELATYTDAAWNALSARDKAIHQKAFCNNEGDPSFRTLVTHEYQDGNETRTIAVPKGDVLHQFRKDVESGDLPAVSWLVAPEHFSDHPGSAWFGAWYLSEAINILTQDPEVWKKTVFILCYDENDGFFDHIPPFVAPHPGRPETGKVSSGMDTSLDVSNAHQRDHSIGLGYRCPLVIVSPWTRGGCVNSQVCDHVSVLMFIENWLAGKGTPVRETNISEWRRTVCGDLTSAFKPYNGEKYEMPKFLERDPYIERIHKASFKSRPQAAGKITRADVGGFQVGAFQESGTKPSCPLPYELEASISIEGGQARLTLEAGNRRNKQRAAGGAFNAYSYGDSMVARAYAVRAGDVIEDSIPVGERSHVRIDGPNGFMRELLCSGVPGVVASVRTSGSDIVLTVKNVGGSATDLVLRDESYGAKFAPVKLKAGESKKITVSTKPGKQWYDFSVVAVSATYRFAGRVENGKWTTSDPAMG